MANGKYDSTRDVFDKLQQLKGKIKINILSKFK